MKKLRNSNILKGKCPECRSTMVAEDGVVRCTQDALIEYAKDFRLWDLLDEDKRTHVLSNQSNIIYDMYQRWSHVNTSGDRPQYCCTYNPNEDFNPMTQSEMILPDPMQQLVAEHFLERDLTPDEYYGQIKVPLLNENGEKYIGQIEQLVFPRDYMTRKKYNAEENPELFRVIFNWNEEE